MSNVALIVKIFIKSILKFKVNYLQCLKLKLGHFPIDRHFIKIRFFTAFKNINPRPNALIFLRYETLCHYSDYFLLLGFKRAGL